MRILIADDERLEREAIRLFLSRYRPALQIVGEAENGNQAVALFRALAPDVVLLDIEMSGCSGLEAAAAIRAESRHVEMVILTAYGSFSYSQQAIRCRVFDYLLKPISEEELSACLHKLEQHLQQRDMAGKPRPAGGTALAYSGQDARILTVMRFISQNLDQTLSLEDLAALVCTTPAYLSRLFRAETGVQLRKFIIQARVERAKQALKYDTDKPLKQIAEEVGFSTVQHFTNTFKKYEQITPLKYREKERLPDAF